MANWTKRKLICNDRPKRTSSTRIRNNTECPNREKTQKPSSCRHFWCGAKSKWCGYFLRRPCYPLAKAHWTYWNHQPDRWERNVESWFSVPTARRPDTKVVFSKPGEHESSTKRGSTSFGINRHTRCLWHRWRGACEPTKYSCHCRLSYLFWKNHRAVLE